MLQVEIDDSVRSLVEATSTNARHVARAEGIRSRIADIDNNGFSVIFTNLSSRDSNSIQNVTDHMRSQFSEWKISVNDNVLRFTLDESIKEEQASLAMQQTLNIMRQRIESLGITEAVTQRQGLTVY